MLRPADRKLRRTPSLTDVDGILVGHYTCRRRPTGCTVVTAPTPFTAGVDVRGGAPGTRETDLLKAENSVDAVHAIVLSGGSSFGLDAASGVVRYLEERGLGLDVQGVRVPIVCGAILFDLFLGDARVRPDAEAGYAAAQVASNAPVAEGNVGAGAGCTVGKMMGAGHAMRGGLGSWALSRPEGLKVGALAAVNCAGDVVDPARGTIVAGARKTEKGGFLDILGEMRRGFQPRPPVCDSTVVAIVATNAVLNKAQCTKAAQMAHDALARCIYPAHTPWDGDTVFALATGRWAPAGHPVDVGLVGALAADALATAILRGVERASSWGSYPAARDRLRKK